MLINACVSNSTIVVYGVVRGMPDISIKSFNVNLKATSKLAFMAREDVERILLKNLHYVPEKRELVIDNQNLLEMVREADVHHTRVKFTEIYCKLMLPSSMLDHPPMSANEETKMD